MPTLKELLVQGESLLQQMVDAAEEQILANAQTQEAGIVALREQLTKAAGENERLQTINEAMNRQALAPDTEKEAMTERIGLLEEELSNAHADVDRLQAILKTHQQIIAANPMLQATFP